MSNSTTSFVTRSVAAFGSTLICAVLMVATVSVDDTRLQHNGGEAIAVAAPQG